MARTLVIKMTAGYYVEALMRDTATPDERRALRALAVLGLRHLKDEGPEDEPLRVIHEIDAEAFTI